MWKRILDRAIPSIALVLAIVGPMIYIFSVKTNQSFWDNLVGNLLSGLIALVAGIPIGFALDRQVQSANEKKTKVERLNRQTEVLSLVRTELDNVLSIFLTERKGKLAQIPLKPLQTELWAVLVSAGEVKSIVDVNLLSKIVVAYSQINLVKEIEKYVYQSANSATVNFGNGVTATQILVREARSFDKELEIKVVDAISEIDKFLGN